MSIAPDMVAAIPPPKKRRSHFMIPRLLLHGFYTRLHVYVLIRTYASTSNWVKMADLPLLKNQFRKMR